MEDYKEKLKLAKEALASGSYDKETIEYIFPELKESEDERIRKATIEFVRQNKSFNYSLGISKEDIIAWLEKQGEQKPIDKVEPKFKVGDTIVVKDLDEYDYETIKNIKDGQYIFTDGYCMNIDEQEGWQLVKTTVNIEQKPKPAWSEEDEVELYNIIDFFESPFTAKLCPALFCNNAIAWLKSLKERMKGE